jgi:hypothetical protein
VLSIENSNTMETSVEVEEGMSIDRGYVSREMITNQVHKYHSLILALLSFTPCGGGYVYRPGVREQGDDHQPGASSIASCGQLSSPLHVHRG